MTVIYSAKVATANFSCFFKLLIRWRGSVYKILWKEFFVFSLAYFLLSFLYRFALTHEQKIYFEMLSAYCQQYNQLIPVAFVLGFYVNHIAGLWWEKFKTLPWPARLAMYVTAHVHGLDERARLMRRTIMRYVCLSYVITMASISPSVKKRFPNFTKMTEAGFMLPKEQSIIENIDTPYNKFFVPLVWASAVVTRARKEGRIKDDVSVNAIIDEINDFRTRLFNTFNYDWINIPLVYTQVVTLAVYTFFISCLMGRQYLDNGLHGDMIFPFFTFLQFLFYMGWLKVAEIMLNPFGEDDDDFDLNYLIDRHLKIAYLVVDGMHSEHPDLTKDQYWDNANFDIPYTGGDAEIHVSDPLEGSAMNIPERKPTFIFPSFVDSISKILNEDGEEGMSGCEGNSPSHGSRKYKQGPATRFGSVTSRMGKRTQSFLNSFKHHGTAHRHHNDSASESGSNHMLHTHSTKEDLKHEKPRQFFDGHQTTSRPFQQKEQQMFFMMSDMDESMKGTNTRNSIESIQEVDETSNLSTYNLNKFQLNEHSLISKNIPIPSRNFSTPAFLAALSAAERSQILADLSAMITPAKSGPNLFIPSESQSRKNSDISANNFTKPQFSNGSISEQDAHILDHGSHHMGSKKFHVGKVHEDGDGNCWLSGIGNAENMVALTPILEDSQLTIKEDSNGSFCPLITPNP